MTYKPVINPPNEKRHSNKCHFMERFHEIIDRHQATMLRSYLGLKPKRKKKS